MSIPTSDRLLTVKELCQVLQTSRRNIELLRKQGMPYYLLGSAPRFDLSEIKQWMRESAERRALEQVDYTFK